jgi:glycine/D-amino acid oxidase-like deaminating enzyme
MKVVVVGNGAVGLMIARAVIKRLAHATVDIVGPVDRVGCASVAAAAMFNSFAEIDVGTLKNTIERKKWLFNHEASPLWPDCLKEISVESGKSLSGGFGTYLINNQASDILEDENYDAILDALREFDEPFEVINPKDIPHYKPTSPKRAGRSVFIPNEGWVNPVQLMSAVSFGLENTGRARFVDKICVSLATAKDEKISGIKLEDGSILSGDIYVLAPGASFSKIIDASVLGISFPRVFYGVGCTVVLGTGEGTLLNCVRTPNRGLACGIYAAPRDSEHTIVGASNFIAPSPMAHARVTSVYTLLKSAMEQINEDFYRSDLTAVNVGWRPTSEDTLPMIGGTAIGNLFVATATKRDGLHCSPLIAECIVDLICGSPSRYDISLFKPDRSPVRTLGREEAISLFVRHSMNANYQHDFVPAKNRMVEQMEAMYRSEIERLHDKVGADDWGIPPEMIDMYRYGHIKGARSN